MPVNKPGTVGWGSLFTCGRSVVGLAVVPSVLMKVLFSSFDPDHEGTAFVAPAPDDAPASRLRFKTYCLTNQSQHEILNVELELFSAQQCQAVPARVLCRAS